jgi:hypothetical protein
MIPKNDLPNLAQDLVRIHKAITRGLTVVVTRGTQFVREGFPDVRIRQGFADYILSLAGVLGAHHLGEDEIAFPAFRPKLPEVPYGRLTADHQFIETSLAVVRMSIGELAAGTSMEGLSTVVEALRKDTEVWIPHIQLEEKYFSQDAIAVVMTPDEQAQVSIALGKHSQEHVGPLYLALPFVLFNLAVKDRAAMSKTLPKQVTEELIPKVWQEKWAPMKPFFLD